MVLACAIALGLLYIKQMSKHWYKNVEIKEYGIELSYPNSYVDIPKKSDDLEQISNNVASIIVKEDIKTSGVSVDMVEEILHAQSDITQMTIYAEAIKKTKTPKTLEEICKNYIVMFKIFNENENVVYEKYETTIIDGIEAGRVEIYVTGKKSNVYPGMISYLIPLEDREITLVFTGTQELFKIHQKEINKIIKSIKLREKLAE